MTAPYFDKQDSLLSVDLREKAGFLTGGLNLTNPPEGISDADSPDLWNIEFTRHNSIISRKFPKNKFTFPSSLKSNIKIKNSFEFLDNNNVGWLIVTDNEDVFITDDLMNFSRIPIADSGTDFQLNGEYSTNFTYCNGKIFGTNGQDPVWIFDVNSSTFKFLDISHGYSEDVPKGRQICTHNSRVYIACTYDDPVALYNSQLEDETLFTNPISGIPNIYRLEAGNGGMIIGIKSLGEELIVLSNRGADAFLGYGESDFRVEPISQERTKACANAKTIQEHNHALIYLGVDRNFYKLAGREIVPIGQKIQPGLKDKVMQVYTYTEVIQKIKDDTTAKLEQGGVPTGPITDTSEFFVANNVNGEIDFRKGLLYTNQSGGGILPNGFFSDRWNKWTKLDCFIESDSYYNPTMNWSINNFRARMNTMHDTSNLNAQYFSRSNKIEMDIIDGHDGSVLGVFTKDPDSSGPIGLPGHYATIKVMSRNYTHTIDSFTPASYTSFASNIGSGLTVTQFMQQIKYRNIKLRLKAWRAVGIYGQYTGWFMVQNGGYSYIESENFYADRTQFAASFSIDSTDYKTDNVNIFNPYGAMTFGRQATDYYESPYMFVNVSKWGSFNIDYTNNQFSTISFMYRINDGYNWGAWKSISPGDSIYYSGIPTGPYVGIQFRIIDDGHVLTGYGAYSFNEYRFISFNYFKKINDIPDIDSDISSIVYDERYYCAMGVNDMGNFFGHNNVMFVYDEWAKGPRWTRWDLWADTMSIFAGQILFMNTDKGFVLGDDANILPADMILYDNGMPAYYKTKSFDFDVSAMLKWFKFINFDFAKGDYGQMILYHIDIFLDNEYSGTIKNYALDPTTQIPYHDRQVHYARVGRVKFLELLFGVRFPQYHYTEDPNFIQEFIIGYSNRIQFSYVMWTAGTTISRKLNAELVNTTVWFEPKDYAMFPREMKINKLRSNQR